LSKIESRRRLKAVKNNSNLLSQSKARKKPLLRKFRKPSRKRRMKLAL